MKRIASLIIFVMLATILAACGQAESTSNAVTAEPAGGGAAEASPAAASPAAADASPAAAGGGTSAAGDTGCTPSAAQVDKLTFWTRATEGDPEYPALQQLAADYQTATNTPVEVVTIPDADFRSKMSISAPAGEGADVFGPVAHDWVGEFAIQKIAQPIPADAIPAKDDIIQAALDAATVDGQLYALPLFVESVALLYNKDMVPNPPTTWDELVKTSTDLTADGKYGFGFPLLEQYHEGPFFNGFGSYIFKYENGQFDVNDIGLNNAQGVEAAKFLRDMYHKQQPSMPEAALDRQNMHTVQEGMMEAGELAMTINGPWREGRLKEAGINYGVAKLPTLPNGEPMRPFLGVQVFAASAYSKNAEAALDFIKFATCTDNAVKLYQGFNKVPVRTSAVESDVIKANPNIAIWNEQAADGVPMPNIPAMSNVWTPWGNAMDVIIGQNASDEEIQQALDAAVEQIKEAIKQTQG